MRQGKQTWIEDTRYGNRVTGRGASVPFEVGTLGAHAVCPLVSPRISLSVWNLFPVEGDSLVLGNARSRRCRIWAAGVLRHLGDWVFCRQLCPGLECAGVRGVRGVRGNEAANHLCPEPRPLSHRREVFKLNAKSDADSWLRSLSRLGRDSHTVPTLTR